MALVFSRKADLWAARLFVGGGLFLAFGVAALYYYAPPEYTRVGYAPEQPVAFSHEQHVGEVGMSCLYCHSNVEESPVANLPSTQTCMNCHQSIKPNSPALEPIRESWKTGQPVAWNRVHKAPDYVYFNHAAHVKSGVGCVSCHGKIDEMKVVRHDQTLSMGWCLDCHRSPEKSLRPLASVTDMDWHPPVDPAGGEDSIGARQKSRLKINPPQQCGACHR